ncbi:MAG: thioredoxin family protein [Acidimicrobiia bacterium]|nr:thioredoxin family protein [Acidimicrobiia bacterium]
MGLFTKRTKPVDLETLSQLDELVQSGRPVLVDFMQTNCQPCRTMDGIVNELAEEFEGAAHVVKANAARVPDAFVKYKVKSTPTFMLLTSRPGANAPTMRWRHSGLVKKDILTKHLQSASRS